MSELACFSRCECLQHARAIHVEWLDTGFYTPKLAEAIVKGAVRALRET